MWVKLAKCCTPVPPDDILGFVTKGGGVSVHRLDCTNAADLQTQPEKVLEVEWAPTGQSMFLVNIQVEALDRARLLSDITMVLSDAHVNILSANLSTTRDRVAKSRFTFEMAEAKHLDTVLKAVRVGARRLRRLPRHRLRHPRHVGRGARAGERHETDRRSRTPAAHAGRGARAGERHETAPPQPLLGSRADLAVGLVS